MADGAIIVVPPVRELTSCLPSSNEFPSFVEGSSNCAPPLFMDRSSSYRIDGSYR